MKYNDDTSLRKITVSLAVILFLLVILFLGWQSMQKFFARVSLDYFYPWFKLSAMAEDQSAQQLLALKKSRRELAQMVSALQKENTRLAGEAAVRYTLRMENDKLRAAMHLRAPADINTVYAEIILRDPLTWNEVFTIDAGSEDGVREGDAVLTVQVSPDGRTLVTVLAGRILTVSNRSATVATLLHRQCTIGVLLSESGQYGILCGSGVGETPVISSLPATGRYAAGEIVLTGGLSMQIPPGLYAGTLQAGKDGSTSRIRDHLFAEAEFKPAADFDKIRFVAVLTREKK